MEWSKVRTVEAPYTPTITSLPKPSEGGSELTWSTYLKAGKKRSGNRKKSTMNSNLEPVMEEGA